MLCVCPSLISLFVFFRPIQCFFVLDELGGRLGLLLDSKGNKDETAEQQDEDGEDEDKVHMRVVPFVHLATGLGYSVCW